MAKVLNFYVDDSGTRHPDHRATVSHAGLGDWFALGGVLVREGEDEANCRTRHENFCRRWGIKYPLHSVDIRHSAGNFGWLKSLGKADHERFMADLTSFMTGIPAIGLACVIDRLGYNDRYTKPYGRKKWMLCKTSFSVSVERAVKYAITIKHKLRVLVERCNKTDDGKIEEYYDELKSSGPPFDSGRSLIYGPLRPGIYTDILYELRFKSKTSPLVQIADLYLWPMCVGGYDSSHRPYAVLRRANRLMDDVCRGASKELGIKYSCFDLVKRKT